MANIFNINWFNAVKNLWPHFWRNTPEGEETNTIALLRSIVKPIYDKSLNLLSLQQATMTFLDYNGQHKVLEEYLNDLYDPTLRRIFITENNLVGLFQLDFYQTGETDPSPTEFYQTGEISTVPVNMYQTFESVSTDNFTINIPVTITFDSTVVTSQVKNYSEASKEFNIVTF